MNMVTPIERDEQLLVVEGLNKSFGPIGACRDVNFELRRGEILGIVGESGSGKTTLLRCIQVSLSRQVAKSCSTAGVMGCRTFSRCQNRTVAA